MLLKNNNNKVEILMKLQDLVDLGARNILMAELPPIDCLPIVITLNSLHSDAFHKRNCIDSLSSVASDHNQLMRQTLKDMQKSSDLHLLYADIHKSLLNILQNTKKLGKNFYDIPNHFAVLCLNSVLS